MLPCTSSSLILSTDFVDFDISVGQYTLKIKNVINPLTTGLTDNFILETMNYGTNTVLDYFDMNGIVITPGQINSPTVEGSPLNKNLYIDYTISFSPTHAIPIPGKIVIAFPTLAVSGVTYYFTLDSLCRVTFGLVSLSGSSISCIATTTAALQ
jgi:hypothetical protein